MDKNLVVMFAYLSNSVVLSAYLSNSISVLSANAFAITDLEKDMPLFTATSASLHVCLSECLIRPYYRIILIAGLSLSRVTGLSTWDWPTADGI